ncbi:hypothetical protein DLJ53_30435 [Acuticoccus sediminis]|uniref:Uncharacterized protein n=1 Tax=Acuticoccus sediminis TaxID=2184697 RepID=A0A8B2NL69_9HYPH|nr:hypothetical protein [Acuticoccus sediminis]RAH96996.1 hypothetical protein DLJ53_30435 [Acuticoccus sediminis]
MTIKTAILAAVIGLATVTGANAAYSAPLGAPAAQADAGITLAGYHGHGYGHKYHHRKYYKQHVYFEKHCYKKKYKVYSHHHHGYVYKFKTVCYKQPVYY